MPVGATAIAKETGFHLSAVSRWLRDGKSPDWIRERGRTRIERAKTDGRVAIGLIKKKGAMPEVVEPKAMEVKPRRFAPSQFSGKRVALSEAAREIQEEQRGERGYDLDARDSSDSNDVDSNTLGSSNSIVTTEQAQAIGEAENNRTDKLEALRRKEWALAHQREIELAVRVGELIPTHLVTEWFSTGLTQMRDVFIKIPDIVDHLGVRDTAKARAMIQREVDRGLEMAAGILEKLSEKVGELAKASGEVDTEEEGD